MSTNTKTARYMRIFHRYLGFFLTGIMAVYAISGIVLIFRNTETFKKEKEYHKSLETNLSPKQLGKELDIKKLRVEKIEGDVIFFKEGTYNQKSGEANYTLKRHPYLMERMTQMHIATTEDPLFWMNIFFGLCLFFFVISSFWMFRPKTSTFKKGLYFTTGGAVLMIIMLWV